MSRKKQSAATDTSHTAAAAAAPDGGYGWIVMMASFGSHIIVDGIAFTFGVFYVEFLDYFKEGKGKTSFVGSVMSGVYLMTAPLASVLVNRFGCRPVAVTGSVIATFGFVVCRSAQSIDGLMLTYGVISGFGLGLMYLPAVIAVSFYFDRRRALATGVAVCGAGVGCFVFAPTGSLLLDLLDWKNAMFVVAAVTVHGCVFGILFRPLTPNNNNNNNNKQTAGLQTVPELNDNTKIALGDLQEVNSDDEQVDVLTVTDVVDINKQSANVLGRSRRSSSVHSSSLVVLPPQLTLQYPDAPQPQKFMCFSSQPTLNCFLQVSGLYLFKDPVFIIPFFANLFATVGLFIPFVFIAERAMTKGIDKSSAMFLLSVIGITNTLGRILVGFLADLKQVSALLLHNVALLLAGLSCFLIRFCNIYATMIIYALVIGLCIATWISLTSIVLCELLGIKKLSNSFGLLNLMRGVSSLIGPPIAGYVYDWTQNYDNSFLVASIMFFIGGAICCLLHLPFFQRFKFTEQQQQADRDS